ncbi:MAG TPA: hypothetical protein VFL77_03090 [Solirubrobacterales bacterium]|nr:hypothetical protein [Solirubrobacterales bacterium]
MDSIPHSRPQASRRLPSFAGNGLPERMRSTAVALLGMTAAAGLALVALFVQPGWPLLEPAPLPSAPSSGQSVAAARKLTLDHSRAAFTAAIPPATQAPPRDESGAGGPSSGSVGSGNDVAGSGGVNPPASTVRAPESVSEGAGGTTDTGESSPPPAPSPAAAPAPADPEVSNPAPSSPQPSGSSSRGKATASSASAAAAVPAPGHSSSGAAAGHASPRGIEASSSHAAPKPPPPAPPPAAAATPAAPAQPAAPGNGNGLAKGHDK